MTREGVAMNWIRKIICWRKRCLNKLQEQNQQVKEQVDEEKGHLDPNNPYWVIYTLALAHDAFVQTFLSHRGAVLYAKKKKKDFVVRQIHICRKDNATKVIESIDMLDGIPSIQDHAT